MLRGTEQPRNPSAFIKQKLVSTEKKKKIKTTKPPLPTCCWLQPAKELSFKQNESLIMS